MLVAYMSEGRYWHGKCGNTLAGRIVKQLVTACETALAAFVEQHANQVRETHVTLKNCGVLPFVKNLPPMVTAISHAVDLDRLRGSEESVVSVVESTCRGLIKPLFDWFDNIAESDAKYRPFALLGNACRAFVLGAWCLVLGAWCLVLGAWCLVLGAWCLVLGAWCLVLGAWCLVLGAWCLVLGAWFFNAEFGRKLLFLQKQHRPKCKHQRALRIHCKSITALPSSAFRCC
jgi:hypothetical protein